MLFACSDISMLTILLCGLTSSPAVLSQREEAQAEAPFARTVLTVAAHLGEPFRATTMDSRSG